MKKRTMDLTIFDEGDAGTDGEQTGQSGTGGGANGYTYEQTEEIANARASKAEKKAIEDFYKQHGVNSDEILDAIKDYKQKKAGGSPDIDALTRERDDALKELENMKHEKLLSDKGVRADDMDYVMFKVNKMIDDKTDFQQAAEKFLKENPRFTGSVYRVSTGTSNSDEGSGWSSNHDADDIRKAMGLKG